MTSSGINWLNVGALSAAGINWADIDVLSDAGINWKDMGTCYQMPGLIGLISGS